MVTRSQNAQYSARKIFRIDYFLKRVCDRLFAVLLLGTLSPLLIAIAIAIKFDSSGNVFFKQTRIGLDGRHFEIWKFRTMVADSEALQQDLETQNEVEGGIIFKMKNDPRITKIGKLLRCYSLDETPQLLNVLLGEMSLIGPRPLPLRDIGKMNSDSDIRHQLLPGISGLSQVNGRSQCSSAEYFYWDKLYVERWSLWLDFKIFFRTIAVVVNAKGAC